MNDSSDLISTAVQAIVAQSQALGLSWNLRIATVVTSSAVKGTTIVFDADTVTISATNMTGGPMVSGARVYVLMTSTGNYIAGFAGAAAVSGLVATVTGQALPDNTATTIAWSTTTYNKPSFITVPGSTITVGESGLYSVTANASTGASGTRNFVEVRANGALFIRNFFATAETFGSTSGTIFLEGGDTLVANVYQNSGGATTMTCAIRLFRMG